ncbi:MAG: hypothetical protein PHP06_10325 [Clostridia bacterium]|nr:hypothetical protein [Clostridia bacterium]
MGFPRNPLGELFVEYGLEIKEKSPYRNTMVFGFTNQSIGYIPTKEAFKNGGYEPTFCESSCLVPEAGGILVKEILSIIDELN